MTQSIAFIGFGEAGRALASGLAGEGAAIAGVYDRLLDAAGTAPSLQARVESVGATARRCAWAAARAADIVFSCVTPDQCPVAATEALPGLRPGQLYLDINSTSPGSKRTAGAIVARAGADYVDAAVMTNVPPHGHRVPMLLAGAGAARAAERLGALGMNVDVVGDEAGQAATIKMCRSVFVKGLDAILYESLLAATRAGVSERVLDSLAEAFPGLDWHSESAARLRRAAVHGHRRAFEMRHATATVRELGVAPRMAPACADVLAELGRGRTAVEAETQLDLARLFDLLERARDGR